MPAPTTTTPTTTVSIISSGPTGFHVVALKCDHHCEDALEIVPGVLEACEDIAMNQSDWWGIADPPGTSVGDEGSDHIEPFDLLDNTDFSVYYAWNNNDNYRANL